MRKQVQIALTVLLIAIVGVFAWQALGNREPVYQGKRLGVWLDEYYHIRGVRVDTIYESGEVVAIRKIGTNALPTLLKMASARDSAFKRKVHDLVSRKSKGLIRLQNDWDSRRKAFLGFKILGPAAAAGVPTLVLRLTDEDAEIRYTAACCLGLIGPAAQDSVPALVQRLGDTGYYVNFASLWALGQIHFQPALAIPALLDYLDTPTGVGTVNTNVVNALGQFGAKARAAAPDILRRLEKMNPQERQVALDALKAIDPEAAAKAGVN